MKKMLLFFGLTALLLTGAAPSQAKTEWELLRDIRLDEKPIDVAMSADGSTAFILTKQTSAFILTRQSIKIYDMQDGRVVDTIPLNKKYTGISTAPRGNILLLTSSSDKSISILQISQSIELTVGTSPVIGPRQAPVTLTAFIDFQCPYCSREFPVIEELLSKYPNDLNVVLKHFPLRSHKFAAEAAVAALAADRQGKYRELTQAMFKNFRSLNEETLKKYAEETGLDLQKFEQDRKDSAFQKQIQEDRQLARKADVRGVPSLYINGQPVTNRSPQGMAAMIDEALKKK